MLGIFGPMWDRWAGGAAVEEETPVPPLFGGGGGGGDSYARGIPVLPAWRTPVVYDVPASLSLLPLTMSGATRYIRAPVRFVYAGEHTLRKLSMSGSAVFTADTEAEDTWLLGL